MKELTWKLKHVSMNKIIYKLREKGLGKKGLAPTGKNKGCRLNTVYFYYFLNQTVL